SEDLALRTAERLTSITHRLGIPFIYKSSYEKDNRSSQEHYRGPGIDKGLRILEKVKEEFDVPVLSDVHRESDVDAARDVLDVIQIPAYLCQQTSLLLKVGHSKRAVNVKKGQFLAPETMRSAVEKLESTGNRRILLTERGTSFGYSRLVSDVCSLPIMKSLGHPVVFDATHIVRIYGVPSADPRGGVPQFIPTLVRAGVAAGANALFLETHPDPPRALCDAASMVRLDALEGLLRQSMEIARLLRKWGES
ncbi:MAG: 3-deoxy-8-phosphooctulonate synthase, partial [Vicinamibacteria bacterium]